jgi:hypothetical protein
MLSHAHFLLAPLIRSLSPTTTPPQDQIEILVQEIERKRDPKTKNRIHLEEFPLKLTFTSTREHQSSSTLHQPEK